MSKPDQFDDLVVKKMPQASSRSPSICPRACRLPMVRKHVERIVIFASLLDIHAGLSKRGLEQTIIKNNELALFHEGNVLEIGGASEKEEERKRERK